MLAVAIAGSVLVLACWYMLSVCRRQRREFQKDIDALAAAIQALEKARTERTPTIDALPVARVAPNASGPVEIPSETHEAIKAALSAFVGHKIRVRSVKLVENGEAATTWATQGRVAVQE